MPSDSIPPPFIRMKQIAIWEAIMSPRARLRLDVRLVALVSSADNHVDSGSDQLRQKAS
jgi:hypothetical protein